MSKLDLYKTIGKGYTRGWFTNCHCRYRVFKGARNTKKSYVIIGIEILIKIMSDERRNVLIIRDTYSSHRFSTFSTLKMLINKPVYDDDTISFNRFFKINESEMIITYKPTGQVIIFKGFDEPQKLQGIRVSKGFLTDLYVEEGFEIDDFDKWRKVDGSIRGKLPEGLFHQITFCFNAWNKQHWLYEHFFKGRLEDDVNYLETHDYQDYKDENLVIDFGKGLYLHTSTYTINEFRDKEIYDVAMEELKRVAPEIYKVEALGMWGNASDSTYPEWNESLIITPQQANKEDYVYFSIGIDTGLSNGEGKIKTGKDVRLHSATAMQLVGLTSDYNRLVYIDEFFHSNEQTLLKKTAPQLQEEFFDKILEWQQTYLSHRTLMKGTILVYVDSADVGFRQGLEAIAQQRKIFNIRFLPSTKERVRTRVDFDRRIMAFGEFLVSSKCQNLIREIKNSKVGEKGEAREDFDDHCLTAGEYGKQPFISRMRRWASYKIH